VERVVRPRWGRPSDESVEDVPPGHGAGPPIRRCTIAKAGTIMSRGQLALDASPATVPIAAVSIIAASGDLDEAAAKRLPRWCETRLHLLDIGHGQIDHLVLDVSHARRATASAVADPGSRSYRNRPAPVPDSPGRRWADDGLVFPADPSRPYALEQF